MDDSHKKELRAKAMRLPLNPGVYLMHDKSGKVIYVGKAKALKNRVSQYFGSERNHDAKVRRMVASVEDFEYILTDSEFEALVLECSLIKQYSPKIVYVIPTFQNPTGKTLPEDRRKAIAEMGSKYDVIILEDDPYCDLRYSGEALLPIKHFDKTGHTVFANSFSKIFSPGSRVGYACADAELIKKLIDAKTATNSHTSMIAQVLCAEFFKRGDFGEHLKKIRAIHKERRDVMMESIDKYFPEGTKRVFPDGGLFTWVELPGDIDTTELLKEANAAKVAYVAGEGFFTEGGGKGKNCFRLSFGSQSPENIRIGIERLANLIKSKM